MKRLVAVALATGGLVVAAGCGSSSSGGPGVGSTPPTGGTAHDLRGVALPSTSCHVQGTTATNLVPVATSTVSSLILCPLVSPNGQRPQRVVVQRSDVHFDPIVQALARPDQPSPATPQPCPEYADQLQLVIAVTPGGAYALAIPVDSCHHYQPAALAALAAARGTGVPASTPAGVMPMSTPVGAS